MTMQASPPTPEPSIQQRSTQFAAADGDSTPPPSLQAFGAIFFALWLLILGLLVLTRLRQVRLIARTAQVQKAVASLPDP